MFKIEIKAVENILNHLTICGQANEPLFDGYLFCDGKKINVLSVFSNNMTDLNHVLLEVKEGDVTKKDIGKTFVSNE